MLVRDFFFFGKGCSPGWLQWEKEEGLLWRDWLSGLWVITKCGCPSSYFMMNIMNMRSGQVYLSGLVASLLQL